MVVEFTRRYPSIRVELVLTARTVDLVAEGIDIAIRAGALPDSSLVAQRVGKIPFVLVAAPSYLNRAPPLESLVDLKQHECLLLRGPGGKTTWHVTGPNGDESVEVHGNLVADDMTFLLHSCLVGAGVSLLPATLAREALASGKLDLVLPEYHRISGWLSVVMPSSVLVPSRVILLRDHLVERLKRELFEAQRRCQRDHAEVIAPIATKRKRAR
jgi:DNA-binding transcriptional LysR family regulator